MGVDKQSLEQQARLTAVQVRYQTWQELVAAVADAERQLHQELVSANDAGIGYRTIAQVLPWTFGYVGQIVRAAREEGADDDS